MNRLLLSIAGGLILQTGVAQTSPESRPSPPPHILVTEEPIVKPDVPAKFEGGTEGMSTFIQKNLVYPKTGIEKKIEGKVYIDFVVEKDGTTNYVIAQRGVTECPEMDAEAIRVVKMMKFATPGTIEGKPVRSKLMIPIEFKL